jgi:hypothetical protein
MASLGLEASQEELDEIILENDKVTALRRLSDGSLTALWRLS